MSLPRPTIDAAGRLVLQLAHGTYYLAGDHVMREVERSPLTSNGRPRPRLVAYRVAGKLADRIRAALIVSRARPTLLLGKP